MVGFSYGCLNAQTHISQWYPCISDDKRLPASGGGSVLDYALVKECDASIVNALDWLIVTELKPQALILAHCNQKLTH